MPRKTIVRGLVTGIVVSDKEQYLGDGFMEAFGNSLTLYVQTANDWVVTTLSGQVSGGFWGGKRRIHLSMSYIATRKNKDIEHLGAMTYLHEATHLYADTDDHGDQGYLEHRADAFVKAPDPYRRTGVTAAQALVNADSYAGFVFAVANPDY